MTIKKAGSLGKIGNKIDNPLPKEPTPRPKDKVFPIISSEEIASNKRNIKYIAIHASATYPSMKVDRERIKGWHLKRGFSDIGYHYLIMRDGSIVKGRDLDGDGLVLEEVGAHVKGVNSVSIGICWIGGTKEDAHKEAEDNRTDEQLKTMKRLIQELSDIYPNAKIRGHRDFPNVAKSCPCFDVKTWCEEVGIKPN